MGISDRYKVGQSKIVPYRHGEDSMDRHARRLDTNLSYESELREFCNTNQITFSVKNEGHHWIFKREKQVAEWWPSSAKLVINKQWGKGFHVHDYVQARKILEKHFKGVRHG